MQLPVGATKRKDFWKSHVEAAEKFNGSLTEYCRKHNLNPGTLSAYRHKLGLSKPRHKNAAFSAVKVTSENTKTVDLPDPKWLAQFLKAYKEL